MLAKAVVVRHPWPEFQLLETMRAEPGAGIIRLERHLQRLSESACYFGFAYDDCHTRAVVTNAVRNLREPVRLRLLLRRDGHVHIETAQLETPPVHDPFQLARAPVQSTDRFLFHKTTHRAVYDRQVALHPNAFDVLLWNERQELTEFTRGNVVLEIEGRKLTPARDCGLLAGTFRDQLLQSGEIEEARVYLADLARATRVWFINSVRGWVEVHSVAKLQTV